MRLFPELSSSERVQVIIALADKPVEKESVLVVSGVDEGSLKSDERDEVQRILDETALRPKWGIGRTKYLYPAEKRAIILATLDVDQESMIEFGQRMVIRSMEAAKR